MEDRWIIVDGELYHHGIAGQKWGHRNGPPYPLDSSQASSAEKSKGFKESKFVSNTNNNETTSSKTTSDKKLKLTDEQKAAIALGATYAALILAVANADKISDVAEKVSSKARNAYLDAKLKHMDRSKFASENGIMTRDKSLVIERINNGLRNSIEGQVNCVHCSMAYVLQTRFGLNAIATPNFGIDEFSGMKFNGRMDNVLLSMFDGINKISQEGRKVKTDGLDLVPDNSFGTLTLKGLGLNHEVAYEKQNGDLRLIDAQINEVVTSFRHYGHNARIESVFDFSNAKFNDTQDIAKYLVEIR